MFYFYSDGPIGKPDLQPPKQVKYQDEIVVLTCNNPTDDGNPNCDLYTWNKLEGNPGDLHTTKIYTFTMNESHAGNYTCRCANQYDTSDVSNTAEVTFVYGSPSTSPSCKKLRFTHIFQLNANDFNALDMSNIAEITFLCGVLPPLSPSCKNV